MLAYIRIAATYTSAKIATNLISQYAFMLLLLQPLCEHFLKKDIAFFKQKRVWYHVWKYLRLYSWVWHIVECYVEAHTLLNLISIITEAVEELQQTNLQSLSKEDQSSSGVTLRPQTASSMASSSSSHARLPRPLSDHLANSSSSPRVRFNLEPMHFEFSDVEDDDQMAFKLRDRSPSDPLISLEETIDLRRYVHSSTFKSTFI